MAARSIASLTLGFGLVAIPVKLYTATEPTAALRFKLMGRQGARLRQQYVVEAAPVPEWEEPEAAAAADGTAEAPRAAGGARAVETEDEEAVRVPRAAAGRAAAPMPERGAAPSASSSRALPPSAGSGRPSSVVQPLRPAHEGPDSRVPAALPEPVPTVVGRAEMLKGFEFEKGRFVLFTPAELKALEAGARRSIDIVAFVPGGSIDPIYYDKAYYLVPEPPAVRTYSLLLETMRRAGRSALAKWAWRGKEYVVEVRAASGGLVLQQLLYAEEVRPIEALRVPTVPVGEAELALATQLVDTITEEGYDPSRFVDEERRRVLEAVEAKVAGRRVVAHEAPRAGSSAEVIDLMEALRASLREQAPRAGPGPTRRREAAVAEPPRKPARRAPASSTGPLATTGPAGRAQAKSRARK